MNANRTLRRRWWIMAAVVALAAFVALNLQTITVAAAFVSADRRPALLNDVEWGNPVTARKFRDRFPLGSSELQLVTWLEENSFTIDRGARRAIRKVSSLPCAETVSVEWAVEASADRIGRTEVHIMEAGCL